MAQKLFPPEMEEKIEERMSLRAARLAEKCSYYGLDVHGNDSLHKPNAWEFLINHKHHLLWCNVFKAASTSWMYNFNVLAGYSPEFLKKTKLVPLILARKRYPRPSVEELIEAQNGSITFLIVRHPFERLLSAYRDKLQFALPHTLHSALGQKIIRKYREKKFQLKPSKYAIRWPIFGEFAEYLIDEYKAGKMLDMHWTPITQFCTPCQVKFDVIAKFETLDEDQQYLIHKAGLSHLIAPQWKNSGKGKNTSDLLKKYYSTLTQRQIREIYEIFKYDFELFGYDPQPYFEMAQADNPVE
ncbi:carbohydrate sulfotransferase 11 isoform X2 [Culicoides brevitarsis]